MRDIEGEKIIKEIIEEMGTLEEEIDEVRKRLIKLCEEFITALGPNQAEEKLKSIKEERNRYIQLLSNLFQLYRIFCKYF